MLVQHQRAYFIPNTDAYNGVLLGLSIYADGSMDACQFSLDSGFDMLIVGVASMIQAERCD
jgi:hypothetical protein